MQSEHAGSVKHSLYGFRASGTVGQALRLAHAVLINSGNETLFWPCLEIIDFIHIDQRFSNI